MKHWCPDNHIIYFSLTPIAKWWSVHGDPIGGDDAWDLSWDEISLWNELRPSRPGCTEHPCQQQLGVQSVWLWPVSLPARWHIWSQLHQLSSEYYKHSFIILLMATHTFCICNIQNSLTNISFSTIWHCLVPLEGLWNLSPFPVFHLISHLPQPRSSSFLYSASHGLEVCHIFISVETCVRWEGSSLADMPRVQRNQRALRPLKLTASTPSLPLPLLSHSSFIITWASWEALAPH